MEKIIFTDKKGFLEKVARMKVGGTKSLHIISDFDLTLTRADVNGKRAVTTWEVCQLGEEYIKERERQKAIYLPIEYDSSIPFEIKNEKMREWWKLHLGALIKYGLTKEMIDGGTLHASITPRQKLDELFSTTNSLGIPFVILSAGLGDVIYEFFSLRKMSYPNMHIISNFFTFDNNGKPTGFQDDIVHACNKSEAHLRGSGYLKDIESRRNVILLGDSPGDAEMVQGVDHENVIKVAFLNGKNDKLDAYKELFDVIITEDGGVDFVLDLLKSLE